MAYYRVRRGQRITGAEMNVLLAMVEVGGHTEAVARFLDLEPATVGTHKYRIAVKLGTNGLSSTGSATVAAAFRAGLLDGVLPLRRPDPAHRLARMAEPYVIRYEDGTVRVLNPWAPKIRPEETETA